MKNVINLTPHEVTILGGETPRVIAASGQVARVSMTSLPAGSFDGIPLVECQAGEVTGLPSPASETLYLTSALVRLAVPTRLDLVSPADFVRDASGKIMGCKALERNRSQFQQWKRVWPVRSSAEFISGLPSTVEARSHSYGHSYRAGGAILIAPKGWWESPAPASVTKTDIRCFDGTGYDWRGRTWDVWAVKPGAGTMVPCTRGEYYSATPEKRLLIGADGRSGDGELYFRDPAGDAGGDFAAALSAVGL